VETFTGTVDGCGTGTITYTVANGSAQLTPNPTAPNGHQQWTIVGGGRDRRPGRSQRGPGSRDLHHPADARQRRLLRRPHRLLTARTPDGPAATAAGASGRSLRHLPLARAPSSPPHRTTRGVRAVPRHQRTLRCCQR
jgi:hypothetical protein